MLKHTEGCWHSGLLKRAVATLSLSLLEHVRQQDLPDASRLEFRVDEELSKVPEALAHSAEAESKQLAIDFGVPKTVWFLREAEPLERERSYPFGRCVTMTHPKVTVGLLDDLERRFGVVQNVPIPGNTGNR